MAVSLSLRKAVPTFYGGVSDNVAAFRGQYFAYFSDGIASLASTCKGAGHQEGGFIEEHATSVLVSNHEGVFTPG